jgi:hypothetical protein
MGRFQHTTPGQADAATRLIDHLLSLGHVVTIDDGEELPVQRSTDRDTILDSLNQCEWEIIRAFTPSGHLVGMFHLIWGNAADGSELIADYSANDACEAIYNAVYPEEGSRNG